MPLDAVDVRNDVRAVDDRHAVAAEHLHRVTGEEERRILVDADAEQSRTARHEGQEATDAIALAEMLVDDHARDEIEPAVICAIRMRGEGAGAVATMWERIEAPALVPATRRPPCSAA